MLAMLAPVLLAAQAQTGNYHVIKTYPVPGSGKWDYLAINPANNHLYIAHGSQVEIINVQNGNPVGVISNTNGVHGIAFDQASGKGFISNGKANTVTVFSLKDDTKLADITTGENPDAIMLEPFSGKIFVGNGISKSLTIIDPVTNRVVSTVALGGKPETAVSDKKGHVFINLEDKSEIADLNVKTFKIEHRWTLGKGKEPSGLAIDMKNGRLFAGCGNNLLMVIDAGNGKVISGLPIGEGCDGVAFDQECGYIFSSNGSGSLSVIRQITTDKYEVQQPVSTPKGAKTLALDEKTHIIYTATSDFEQASADDKPRIKPGTFRVVAVGLD
jgi:YVTN family beta-propeller protein